MQEPERAPWVVIGIGNELFQDEGLGIAAAKLVGAMQLPGIEVLDGGTLGLAITPEMEGRQGVLVFDAVVGGGAEPGDVLILQDGEIPSTRQMLMSVHQIGVVDAISAMELTGLTPKHIAACGIVPTCLEVGWGLTPETEARMPALVSAGLQLLVEWGAVDAAIAARHTEALS
jgi:hydrogenase maturation protease